MAAVRSTPLSDSSFIQQLDPRLAKPFLVGFSEAMDLVFLIGSAVMVIAFVVVWFLPHVELRGGSAYNDRGGHGAPTGPDAVAPADSQAPADAVLVSTTGADAPETAEDDGSAAKTGKRGRHRAEPGEKLH